MRTDLDLVGVVGSDDDAGGDGNGDGDGDAGNVQVVIKWKWSKCTEVRCMASYANLECLFNS